MKWLIMASANFPKILTENAGNLSVFRQKRLKRMAYIRLYNMRTVLLHTPNLASVQMVEKAVFRYSQEYTKYQLWKKLPRKMMYQTFCAILEYLEQSGKLHIDKRDGIVYWTWDPEFIEKLRKKGLLSRR